MTGGESAAAAFAALGDPTRRDVLDALRDGERSVGEIVADLGLAQPRVSKHLRALADWLTRYEVAVNARLDRAEAYLYDLQGKAGTP